MRALGRLALAGMPALAAGIRVVKDRSSEGWRCLKKPSQPGCPQNVPEFTWNNSEVRLAEEGVVNNTQGEYHYEFYRNNAYKCGIPSSGHYTFAVIEAPELKGKEAPLWVWLHGGGFGYFHNESAYYATVGQDVTSMNTEESFGKLWDEVTMTFMWHDGETMIDSTLLRRWKEGYRILAVSLSDHDCYAGTGTPYIKNPDGGEVNGLQGTWAAVDYTLKNYQTSKYFLHGCSAGSVGVHGLATAMSLSQYQPLPVAGIADSWHFTARQVDHFATVDRSYMFRQHPDFVLEDAQKKIGFYGIPENLVTPEAIMRSGFDEVPLLYMYGTKDPGCGGLAPPIPKAEKDGFESNCAWLMEEVAEAIKERPSSRHVVKGLQEGVHCPSVLQGDKVPNPEAYAAVDAFIRGK